MVATKKVYTVLTGDQFQYKNFELGAGFSVNEEQEIGETVIFTAATGNIGYRYQPETSGILFRAGLATYIAFPGEASEGNFFLILPGVSIGYTFCDPASQNRRLINEVPPMRIKCRNFIHIFNFPRSPAGLDNPPYMAENRTRENVHGLSVPLHRAF